MRIQRPGGDAPQGSTPTTHVAQEGETLKSIADNYGLMPDTVAKANMLPSDAVIRAGQELIIPAAGKLVAEKTPGGVGDIKDSFEIGAAAKAFVEGAAAKAFVEGAAAKAFVEGAAAKAFVEGAAAKAFVEGAAAKAFVEGSSFQNYIIQQADTVGSIASRFGISAEELAKLNNLATDARLQPGMELKIPIK